MKLGLCFYILTQSMDFFLQIFLFISCTCGVFKRNIWSAYNNGIRSMASDNSSKKNLIHDINLGSVFSNKLWKFKIHKTFEFTYLIFFLTQSELSVSIVSISIYYLTLWIHYYYYYYYLQNLFFSTPMHWNKGTLKFLDC